MIVNKHLIPEGDLPDYIMEYHRIARRGDADGYSTGRTIDVVRFDLLPHERELYDSLPEDVINVRLVYRRN